MSKENKPCSCGGTKWRTTSQSTFQGKRYRSVACRKCGKTRIPIVRTSP